MFVNDSVEELAIPPAGGEVLTANVLIAVGNPLRPEQQLLFGCHVLRLTVDLDVGDLRQRTGIQMLGVADRWKM